MKIGVTIKYIIPAGTEGKKFADDLTELLDEAGFWFSRKDGSITIEIETRYQSEFQNKEETNGTKHHDHD